MKDTEITGDTELCISTWNEYAEEWVYHPMVSVKTAVDGFVIELPGGLKFRMAAKPGTPRVVSRESLPGSDSVVTGWER